MYFNQYSIKPAFATLTSLLRTFSAHYLTVAFSIYLQVFGFGWSYSSSLCFPPVSILFSNRNDIRHLIFFPSLSVGSAKVEIFSELPNKIILFFSSFFSLQPFNMPVFKTSFLLFPNRDAKVMIFFTWANFIWNKFRSFYPLSPSLTRFSIHPFPPKRDAKVAKINTVANLSPLFYPLKS